MKICVKQLTCSVQPDQSKLAVCPQAGLHNQNCAWIAHYYTAKPAFEKFESTYLG
jgi:hypothetical protein